MSTTYQEDLFGDEYLQCVLALSMQKIAARLNTLNYAGSNNAGPKAAARGEKLLTIDKVIKALDEFIKNKDVSAASTIIQERYTKGTRILVASRRYANFVPHY
jgi:hypothetical protein